MSSSDRPSFRRMVFDCVIVSRRRSLFVPVMLSFSAGPASKALSAAICLQHASTSLSAMHLKHDCAAHSRPLHSSWLPEKNEHISPAIGVCRSQFKFTPPKKLASKLQNPGVCIDPLTQRV